MEFRGPFSDHFGPPGAVHPHAPAAVCLGFDLPESGPTPYIALVVNNRKEVIQCLIVYRRGRRHSGSSPRTRYPSDAWRHLRKRGRTTARQWKGRLNRAALLLWIKRSSGSGVALGLLQREAEDDRLGRLLERVADSASDGLGQFGQRLLMQARIDHRHRQQPSVVPVEADLRLETGRFLKLVLDSARLLESFGDRVDGIQGRQA